MALHEAEDDGIGLTGGAARLYEGALSKQKKAFIRFTSCVGVWR
ncbi:MAG: hypothetical protein AAF135_19070 [Bacteroidota bacterium]